MSQPTGVVSLKDRLRQQFLEKRRAVGSSRKQSLDALICGHLLQVITTSDRPNKTIAAFVSHGGEPDLGPIFEALIGSGRQLFLPVVDGETMRFHRYQPDVVMRKNRFGIPEPLGQPSVLVQELDWILMPLVAFSSKGVRLGMGGGFYDRTLANIDRSQKRPLLAGVSHSLSQAESIPSEPWDVPMDLVISDRGILWVE